MLAFGEAMLHSARSATAMSDDIQLSKLRAQLEVMTAQRDSALIALEEAERQAEEQHRLLTEEQDRFVAKLLDSHERETGHLRGELSEARDTSNRVRKKLARAKQDAVRAEEEHLRAHCIIEQLTAELRDTQRQGRLNAERLNLASLQVVRLEKELETAREMLGDAMGDDELNIQVRFEPTEPLPRPSGILARTPSSDLVPEAGPRWVGRIVPVHRAAGDTASLRDTDPPPSR